MYHVDIVEKYNLIQKTVVLTVKQQMVVILRNLGTFKKYMLYVGVIKDFFIKR